MKSLSKFVTESFFETKNAPGETIQFRPLDSYAEKFGLNGSEWYVGTVNAVKIDRFEQWYFVNYNGVEIGPIHELNIKQDINQIITNESLREAYVNEDFYSNYKIDDYVEFYPMYKHQQELGISADQLCGKIVSVKFTAAKVFYTIIDDYFGKMFDDVDSSKVSKPVIVKLEESEE